MDRTHTLNPVFVVVVVSLVLTSAVVYGVYIGVNSIPDYDTDYYMGIIPDCPDAGYSEWSVPVRDSTAPAKAAYIEKGWHDFRLEREGRNAHPYLSAQCDVRS